MIHFWKWVLPMIIIIGCSTQDKEEIVVIARVGDKTIQINEFKAHYSEYLNRTGAKDNLIFRNQFLDREVDRLVLLSAGDSLGLSETPEIKDKITRARLSGILDEFFYREVFQTYQASDSLLRNAFQKSKTEIHVRHLYANSLEKANQLKTQLNAGVSFEELAITIFQDSALAATGGDLGYFSLGDMDPAFEDAAFALKDGEISEPIRTRYGYSIIQTLDRWTEPIITEQDYQLHKEDMNAVLRSRNVGKRRQEMTDSLAAELNLSISENDLNLLFTNRSDIFKGEIAGIENEAVQLICTLGIWNSFEIFKQMQSLSNSQKQKIKSKENLRDALSGLLVRKKIIELANEKDWFIQNKFQDKLERAQEDITIKYTLSYFLNDIKNQSQSDYIILLDDLKANIPIHIDDEIVRRMVISS